MENEIIINWVTYVRKEEKKQSKRGNKYWYFCNGWEVEYGYNITDIDKAFCYPTESEVAKARDKMLALYRIKEEFYNKYNKDITHYNIAQTPYMLFLDVIENKFEILEPSLNKPYCWMYWSKKELEYISNAFEKDLLLLFS